MEPIPNRFNAATKSLGKQVSPPSVKLKHLKITLARKFTSISIHQTISRYGVPFLHIWKPISRYEGVQGMEFLPCFHIIVTITNEYAGIKQSGQDNDKDSVLFQLHSFHGKVLAEELHFIDQCDSSNNYDLISKMATDKLQLCHGIDEIDRDTFISFIQSCNLPLLNKFKSIFLIEQFMGTVLMRSRLCKFVLYDEMSETVNDPNNFRCCEECFAMQDCQESSAATSNYEEHIEGYESGGGTKTLTQNIFEKVFSQTSIFDLESMAMIQRVNTFSNSSTAKKAKDCTVKQEPQTDMTTKKEASDTKEDLNFMDNDVTDESLFGGHFRNESELLDANTLYQNEVYGETTNYFNRDSYEATNMSLKPAIDMQTTVNDDNSYVDSDPSFVRDSNVNSGVKGNLVNTASTKLNRVLKRKKRIKTVCTDDKPFSDEPHYKVLMKERLMRRQVRLERKETLFKEKQFKRQERKERRERKLRDKELTGKKEFRRICMICLYEFQSECNYNTDQLRHHQAFGDMEQSVACPLCQESIETKYMITTHFEERHANQNVTCCCECLEVIPKGSNRLRRHILKSHHSATEKQVCPECGQECAGNAKLEIHMAETHSDKKAAVCEECGKSFGHLKVYKQHLRRHHNPRDLECLQCDKKFEHRQQAIDHLVVHTGIKPYKCVQCNYVSYRISNVICIHFMKCHGRKGISATDLTTDIVERDRMMEIARAGVQEMVKVRDLKLKKEVDR